MNTPDPSALILVGGGARAGKSRFALSLARGLAQARATMRIGFVATAEARDDEEMRQRIAAHKAEREATFVTIEEPVDVSQAVGSLAEQGFTVVVVDCATLWLTNLLLRNETEQACLARVESLVEIVRQRRLTAIVVTNEVGLGLVPETPLGRVFRDLAGRAHQCLAARADQVYLGALGLIVRLHPAPVTAYLPGQTP